MILQMYCVFFLNLGKGNTLGRRGENEDIQYNMGNNKYNDCITPEQLDIPLPLYPAMQAHENELTEFVHDPVVARQLCNPEVHSFVSIEIFLCLENISKIPGNTEIRTL